MNDKVHYALSSERVINAAPPSSNCGTEPESALSPVAKSDGLEGDLPEVHGGATSSLAFEALVVPQGSDFLVEEKEGKDRDLASSIVPVLGNSSVEVQAAIGVALLSGDAQVSHGCFPLVSESLEILPTVMADLGMEASTKEKVELGLKVLPTVPEGGEVPVHW
ncbi:hypothetical protein Dimus_010706 [Dionaea muscipula]